MQKNLSHLQRREKRRRKCSMVPFTQSMPKKIIRLKLSACYVDILSREIWVAPAILNHIFHENIRIEQVTWKTI